MIYDLQKASMLKRISAFIFDFILTIVLATFFAGLVSLVTGYDGYNARLTEYYAKYESEYGVKFEITEEEYKAFTAEEKEAYDTAYKALVSDKDAVYVYNMVINLTLLIVSLGIFLGVIVMEFIVPLFLKNGQTLGKKIFGIGLVRTDGVRINDLMLLIRTLLGKYTIEIMIPVLIFIMIMFNSIGIIGGVIIILLFVLQLVCFFVSGTNSFIHDTLAKTVAVDMATQMIFASEKEMLDYKQKMHAEKVKHEDYR